MGIVSIMITKALAFFKSLPLTAYLGIGTLLLLSSLVWYCDQQVDDKVKQAEVIGRTEERNKQLEQTIENTKTAEKAREDIAETSTAGDLTRYNQCLRSARTPENCKRFLSDVQTN